MTAEILALLNAAAARYNVPASLVIAQAEQESGGNQYDAHGNVLTSPAGAMGVMQLEPATAADLGVDPADAAQNIDGGVRYLAQLLKQFNGNQQLALAAYNWGPGHVSNNGFNNWPAETVSYVSAILGKVGAAIGIPSSGSADTGSQDAADGSQPDPGGGGGGTLALVLIGLAGLWFWSEMT